jgi:hypothetical protein
MEPIYFYLPKKDWHQSSALTIRDIKFEKGQDVWLLQTYLHLKERGLPCQLVSTLPESGIVVIYRESLPFNATPSPSAFWVCIKGDQNPLPYAHIHVVQNRAELEAPALAVQSVQEDRYLLPSQRFYIPLWSQPDIIPRDSSREDRFETIAYYGISYNLAPALRSPDWAKALADLGLCWHHEKQSDRWHDYREVDAILAVRSFNQGQLYPWKPPSKLFNAWGAGVPAILGVESAFQSEQRSSLDYLEVSSYTEALAAITRLRDDRALRRAMVAQGQQRLTEIMPDAIANRWKYFLTEVCQSAYAQWQTQPAWQKRLFFAKRYLATKASENKRRFLKQLAA